MTNDMDRLKMILTADDMSRIKEQDGRLRIDLHGKKKQEARWLLNTVINIIRHPFMIDVIHGYNHGIVLKAMIFEEDINRRITRRVSSNYNMGETYILVA